MIAGSLLTLVLSVSSIICQEEDPFEALASTIPGQPGNIFKLLRKKTSVEIEWTEIMHTI